MKLKNLLSVNCLVLVTLYLFLLRSASPSDSLGHHKGKGSCSNDFYDPEMTSTLGGLRDSVGGGAAENSLEIESLGRFAVDEHNKKENALLEFGRVVKAQDQVVAGTLHHLTIEVTEGGKKKLYEAKVWEKPWMNFKELQEFKHAGDVPSLSASDLGAMRGDPPQGAMEVPVHDPEVQNAANHALKTIQQRSNSLLPYELQEVTHAKAEMLDDHAKFHLGLRVKRGDKEENYNVEVHKKEDGNFHLNKMG